MSRPATSFDADAHLLEKIQQFASTNYRDPHHILGLHPHPKGEKVVRLWRPGAKQIFFELFGEIEEAFPTPISGLFERRVLEETDFCSYRVFHQNGLLAHDPYSFSPSFTSLDEYLFAKGEHQKLYRVLGASLTVQQGVRGVAFTVWAPNATQVSLVADYNYWNGRVNPMRALGSSGVWELFVPGIEEGEKYKFEVRTRQGELKIKSDPFAFHSELRPNTASIVCDPTQFSWSDQEWLAARKQKKKLAQPFNVYELHLGSWKGAVCGDYRTIAPELASYCKEMGFTHVELLPVQEHPLDESWGYQVTGHFAPTSRYGTPSDFQYFVNYLHREGIGVIVDWVGGHFPIDCFALGQFDGTALYEHEDPRQGFHPHWSTHIFNFGRHEVANFLLASALYWFDVMHVDGLRVDAVASMLYLDYGREPGHWIPNVQGGRENLQAIQFLQQLNATVKELFPDVWMIAEESSSFPGVTRSVDEGGLGFDLKWNMGWMHDTLHYFSKEPKERASSPHQMTFGHTYFYSERYQLPFSHDEVVHGKKSLLGRMPGNSSERYAHLRLLYTYLICQPGKKLLFMGGEWGQEKEWDCMNALDWSLLDLPEHQGIHCLVRDLNQLYLQHPALWERDFDREGFSWVQVGKEEIFAYLRKSAKETLLCVHNCGTKAHKNYPLSLEGTSVNEIFTSEDECYGGIGSKNPSSGEISLFPLSTHIFSVGERELLLDI